MLPNVTERVQGVTALLCICAIERRAAPLYVATRRSPCVPKDTYVVWEAPRAALSAPEPGKCSVSDQVSCMVTLQRRVTCVGVAGDNTGQNSHTRTHLQMRRRQAQERSGSCTIKSPRAACGTPAPELSAPALHKQSLACCKLAGTEPALPRLIMRLSKIRT